VRAGVPFIEYPPEEKNGNEEGLAPFMAAGVCKPIPDGYMFCGVSSGVCTAGGRSVKVVSPLRLMKGRCATEVGSNRGIRVGIATFLAAVGVGVIDEDPDNKAVDDRGEEMEAEGVEASATDAEGALWDEPFAMGGPMNVGVETELGVGLEVFESLPRRRKAATAAASRGDNGSGAIEGPGLAPEETFSSVVRVGVRVPVDDPPGEPGASRMSLARDASNDGRAAGVGASFAVRAGPSQGCHTPWTLNP